MDWTTLLGIGANAASGGAFGLLGSIIGAIVKSKERKDTRAFETMKWDHEKDLLRLSMEARSAETESELAIVSQEGAWEGLQSSHLADAAIGASYPWVNAIKCLFRPALTAGLVGITAFIFVELCRNAQLATILGSAATHDLIQYVVYSTVFSACTAVVWWFGDRAFTPPDLKNR